eukprot:m.438270 g.438270  ORF g.438270 m.438270 type:complete len:86 (+) comp21442_c1_seq5:391-648(+)
MHKSALPRDINVKTPSLALRARDVAPIVCEAQVFRIPFQGGGIEVEAAECLDSFPYPLQTYRDTDDMQHQYLVRNMLIHVVGLLR